MPSSYQTKAFLDLGPTGGEEGISSEVQWGTLEWCSEHIRNVWKRQNTCEVNFAEIVSVVGKLTFF